MNSGQKDWIFIDINPKKREIGFLEYSIQKFSLSINKKS